MITIHFCIESFDPRRGGMEESALRVMQLLASQSNLRLIVYVFGTIGNVQPPRNVDRVIDIASQIATLLEPLGSNSVELAKETTRLQVLLLRNAIRREVNQRREHKHILLSFCLSTAGFVTQHVANELGKPHIACARGTDIGRNIFTQSRIAAIEFVMTRAFGIITTNVDHRRLAQDIGNRSEGLHVIYNSLPPHVRPVWRPHHKEPVRLVSLGGYSFKKGTHLLLEVVAQLIDEGLPVNLEVAGPTGTGNWQQLRKTYSKRYGSRFTMSGTIIRENIEKFIIDADIYCSASLSEGCSNATMLALALGIPIVSTATGALVDLAIGLEHVSMSSPSDKEDFANALRHLVLKTMDGSVMVDTARLDQIVDRLSAGRESREWLEVIHAAAKSQQRSI